MNKNQRNVGTLERVTRIVGGALAAGAGLYVLVIGSSLWLNALAVAGIALGLDFVYTGVTAYCPLYAKLRWSTAHGPSARREPARATRTDETNGGAHNSDRVVLPILMACAGGDASTVERLIGKLPGVLHAYVNPATENAYIDYDPACVTPAAIADRIRELGYQTEASAR
jgi:copper chaperone CopZ